MSPSIWTQCEGETRIQPLRGRAWRVVESQNRYSTMKLADSVEDQELLETLIEGVKPPRAAEPEAENLHFLLHTPFRYPPLPHGSRFGSRHERSLFYASEHLATAFAEKSYYLLLFLEGTAAELDPVTVSLTAFVTSFRTESGIDLCESPFDAFHRKIRSPTTYQHSQPLGSAMRAGGVEAFRFPSARDPEQRPNCALFTPKAFHAKSPLQEQSWHCDASKARLIFTRHHGASVQSHRFVRNDFTVRGQLPRPAI